MPMPSGIRIAIAGFLAALCMFVSGQDPQCPAAYEKLASTERLDVVFSNGPVQSGTEGLRVLDIRDRITGERWGGITVSTDRSGVAHILSLSVVKARRGQGIGPEALAPVLEYLFETSAVREVRSEIGRNNTPSIRAHEKLGFTLLKQGNPNFSTYHVTRQSLAKALAKKEGPVAPLRARELAH